MEIFGFIINRASYIKKVLEKERVVNLNDNDFGDFNQLFGIYSSRIFGICIYRTIPKMEKDMLEIIEEQNKNNNH